MKIKFYIQFAVFIGLLLFTSCNVQTKEIGFGGGQWNNLKVNFNNAKSYKTDSISVAKNEKTLLEIENRIDESISAKEVKNANQIGILKSIHKVFSKNQKSVLKDVQTATKNQKQHSQGSLRKSTETLAWASVIAGLLACLVSSISLKLIFALLGAIFGLLGLKLQKNLLSYLGIGLSILAIFSGLISVVLTIVLIVLLVLILLMLLRHF